MDLMRGAAQSGDVPFIELVWDRLSQDVQRDARGNSGAARDLRRGPGVAAKGVPVCDHGSTWE